MEHADLEALELGVLAAPALLGLPRVIVAPFVRLHCLLVSGDRKAGRHTLRVALFGPQGQLFHLERNAFPD